MQKRYKVKWKQSPFQKVLIKMSFLIIMKSSVLFDRDIDLLLWVIGTIWDVVSKCTEQSLRVHAWNLINLEMKDPYQQITFIWHLSGEHWDLTDLKLACECEKYHFCSAQGNIVLPHNDNLLMKVTTVPERLTFFDVYIHWEQSLTAVSFRKKTPLVLKFLNFSCNWLLESNMDPIWANSSTKNLQLSLTDSFP